MKKANIRPAASEDYDQLMQLYNAFVSNDTFSDHHHDSFKHVLDSDSSYIYVAEAESRLVGFVTFSVRHLIQYPKPVVEIDGLFVGISFRKHGLGHDLYNQVEKIAKEKGCEYIFAKPPLEHEPAQQFYARKGFKKVGYHMQFSLS